MKVCEFAVGLFKFGKVSQFDVGLCQFTDGLFKFTVGLFKFTVGLFKFGDFGTLDIGDIVVNPVDRVEGLKIGPAPTRSSKDRTSPPVQGNTST